MNTPVLAANNAAPAAAGAPATTETDRPAGRRWSCMGRGLATLTVLWALSAPAVEQNPTPGAPAGASPGDAPAVFTGLAAAVGPAPFTGAAMTSIPLVVVPGRLGMQPELALQYSSRARRGPCGKGWELPLARIERSRRRGVPRFDDGDEFDLLLPSGMIELQDLDGAGTSYGDRWGGPGLIVERDEQGWTLFDPDGRILRFGTSAASRTGGARGVGAWLIDRIEDQAGNHVDFDYLPEDDPAASDATARMLPDRIRYGGNLRQRFPHFATVEFSWMPTSPQSKAPRSWAGGYEERSELLLQAVETFAEGRPARRYELDYDIDRHDDTATLAAVTLTGFALDPTDDVTMPATVFQYTPSVRSGWSTGPTAARRDADSHVFAGPALPRLGGNPQREALIDIDGDSVVDLVSTLGATPTVRFGTGSGLREPVPWAWEAAPGLADMPRWITRHGDDSDVDSNIFDLTGDGLPDLVDGRGKDCGRRDPHSWCVYRNNGTGFEPVPEQWWAPLHELRHADAGGHLVYVDIVDLNGDGLGDWVDSRSWDADEARWWTVHWNTGHGFEQTPTKFPAPKPWITATDGYRNGSWQWTHWSLFDLNGDGLADLVDTDTPGEITTSGNYLRYHWDVYWNQGDGFAASAEPWSVDGDGAHLPYSTRLTVDEGRTTIADVFDITGDGLPDVVRRNRPDDPARTGIDELCSEGPTDCESVYAFDKPFDEPDCCYQLIVHANTGRGFGPPLAWASPGSAVRSSWEECPGDRSGQCARGAPAFYDHLDMDGDGLIDYLQVDPRTRMWRITPHPAARAGVEPPVPAAPPATLVAMLNGMGAVTTLTYATTARAPGVPFGLWVLDSRGLDDGRPDTPALAWSYRWEGAAWDSRRREFAGFASVTETDDLGRTRRDEFHQDKARRGRRLRTTTGVVEDGGTTRTDQVHEWNWSADVPTRMLAERHEPWFDGRPLSGLVRSTTFDYDAWGNVTARRDGTGWVETSTFETVSARTAGRHRVRRPLARVLRNERGYPVQEQRFHYDWDGPSPGALQIAAHCMEWAAAGCRRWSERRFDYDRFGNVVAASAPEGGTTLTGYDPLHVHALTSTDAAGRTTRSIVDARTAAVLRTTTPDGIERHTRFDGMARPIASWRPGFDAANPLVATRYVAAGADGTPGRVVRAAAGESPVVVFHDGLGRELARQDVVEVDGRLHTRVSGLRRHDAGMLVTVEALPFLIEHDDLETLSVTVDDAPETINYAYDQLGRLTQRRAANGAVTKWDRRNPGHVVRLSPNLTDGTHPGLATIETLDPSGRVVEVRECRAAPTAQAPWECPVGGLLRRKSLRLDVLGRLIERRIEGDDGAVLAATRIAYDGLGNRASVQDVSAGLWLFEYDRQSRLVRAAGPDGPAAELSWDAAGRVTSHSGGDERTRWRYRKRAGGIGKVDQVVVRSDAATVRKRFEYDALSQLVGEEIQVKLRGQRAVTSRFGYEWDALGRRTAVVYPPDASGRELRVTTAYDQLGNVEHIDADGYRLVDAVGYDLLGHPVRIDYANSVRDLARWDPAMPDAPLCLRTTTDPGAIDACAGGSADMRRQSYEHRDAEGHLLSIRDGRAPTPVDEADVADSHAYAYDEAGRLVSWTDAAGTTTTYDYDALDQLLRRGSIRYRYDPTAPGRLTGIVREDGAVESVHHNARGNVTAKGDHTYDYDALDRLRRTLQDGRTQTELICDEGGAVVATYDHASDSHRYRFGGLLTIEGDTMIRYVSMGSAVVAYQRIEAPGRRSRQRRSSSGNGATDARGGDASGPSNSPAPPTMRSSQAVEWTFVHRDHQGSARLLTSGDGRVVRRMSHDPWGRRIASTQQDAEAPGPAGLGFTGHDSLGPSDLVHMGARVYDPDTARFLTMDPAFQFASPWSYGAGNPVLGRDGDGRIFGLAAVEILAALTATATFIDALVAGANPLDATAAAASAGIATVATAELSGSLVGPLVQGSVLARYATAAATVALPVHQTVGAFQDGNAASGILSAALLAAGMIGVEITGPGLDDDSNGIVVTGQTAENLSLRVQGICATAPGCVTNFLRAARENLRLLATGKVACNQSCEHLYDRITSALDAGKTVNAHCNSFGGTRCAGALTKLAESGRVPAPGQLNVTISGAPLITAPRFEGVQLTYLSNLMDPVAWTGPLYATPFRSDVVLGPNWWVPVPLLVHTAEFYELPVGKALGAFVGVQP
jgi:RHS repeat-associated protein